MVAKGHVKNGVIVLSEGIRLPEGQEVTVLTIGKARESLETHSIMDIPPVSVGSVLQLMTADDDLLGEMLEGRV